MRTAALALNSVVTVFFSCLLAYTIFGRAHLAGQCRDYALQQTVEYSDPVMDVVGKALAVPFVEKVVPASIMDRLQESMQEYRQDPGAYISKAIAGASESIADSDNPILKRLASAHMRIKAYFNETVDALIVDLRIFALTNLVVGMFALVLAYRSPVTDLPRQLLLSCVMCLSVAYCSYMYVDSLSFFRILAQAHMGWWYPVMLGVIVVILSGGLRRLVSNSSASAP